ncbi:isoprenyl transferase [Olsenella urininfantis]|uniref:isoprenyl transferase n=1 Tax=Olsenella urininfantis TaxID=1871033 RepID=UPI000984710B|nr:isoprenyl transferase [Olsenella urininfantis]
MQVDEEKLRQYFSRGDEGAKLGSLDLSRMPRHVSIIMDGNGRWAQERGLERSAGHVAGVDSLREAVTTSVRLGIDVLSVYAFSTENWNRPQHEVDLLMHLFATTLLEELPLFHQENVRLRFFGDLTALPKETFEVFQEGLRSTQGNDGMVFALAVNYGSRAELVRAARELARMSAGGELDPNDIDSRMLEEKLYTAGLPDPDLLIRSSGELRLSNFLLWQLAYAELYVSERYWPDFSRWDYLQAVLAYQSRNRRFGGISA